MNNTEHEIRIIGGKYKGKLLKVLDEQGLRPTPNRVRETIFSWLKDDIQGANVLDLFAGSGALGFEAYSRGAASVTLIELNKNSAKLLKETANSMDSKNISVVNEDALNYLSQSKAHFDVVFIDPPYKLDVYEKALSLLNKNGFIDNDSIIYVEIRNGSSQAVPGFEIYREQAAGLAKYSLWRKSKLLF